jgi:hypothetical protein
MSRVITDKRGRPVSATISIIIAIFTLVLQSRFHDGCPFMSGE